MARIEVTAHMEASPERVWGELVRWEDQPRWMVDLDSLTVLTPEREGTGVTLRARTRVMPGLLPRVLVDDDMTVTDWQEPEVIAIRHLGPLINGVGAFELERTEHGTLFTWWEEITPPLGGLGDALVGLVVVPHLERVFRRSVARLKRRCEAASSG